MADNLAAASSAEEDSSEESSSEAEDHSKVRPLAVGTVSTLSVGIKKNYVYVLYLAAGGHRGTTAATGRL